MDLNIPPTGQEIPAAEGAEKEEQLKFTYNLPDKEFKEYMETVNKAKAEGNWPLKFIVQAHTETIPMDQTDPHEMHKELMRKSDARRRHVHTFIHRQGGWLIDRKRTRKLREEAAKRGDKKPKPLYKYVKAEGDRGEASVTDKSATFTADLSTD